VLAKAFRLGELSWSFVIYASNEPKQKFVSAERRNQRPTGCAPHKIAAMAAYRSTGDARAA
jgi:hypothetical protein